MFIYQITSLVKGRLSYVHLNTSIERQLTYWVWANHIVHSGAVGKRSKSWYHYQITSLVTMCTQIRLF